MRARFGSIPGVHRIGRLSAITRHWQRWNGCLEAAIRNLR
jgi:hypothetical protein